MKVTLIVFFIAATGASLAAQATTPITTDSAAISAEKVYRDPHKALILGTILPGAGYMYTGEYLRGYGTWVATVGSLSLGPLVYVMDGCTFAFLSLEECKPGPVWPYRLAGILMTGAGVWSWISSARDAPHSAERANAKHRLMRMKVDPFINHSSGEPDQWQAGLALRW